MFQNSDSVTNYCSKIVRSTTDNQNFQVLCREWIETAFGVCLNFSSQINKNSSKFWSWILKLWFQGESKDLETSYSRFIRKPHNLTVSECNHLAEMVLKTFLHASDDCEMSGKIDAAQNEDEGASMWIRDFFIYINVFLIVSLLFVSWIFPDPLGEEPEILDTTSKISEIKKSTNLSQESCAENGDKTQNEKHQVSLEAAKKIFKSDDSKRENENKLNKQASLDKAKDSIEEKTVDEKIKSNESLDQFLQSYLEEQQQKAVNKALAASNSSLSSSNSPQSKKPIRNFIHKNIAKVILQSETLYTNPSRLTLTPQAPAKNRKSLIPVRAASADSKIQAEESKTTTTEETLC